MPISLSLADALAARTINRCFGTTYDVAALRQLEDAHVEELLTAAALLNPKDQSDGEYR